MRKIETDQVSALRQSRSPPPAGRGAAGHDACAYHELLGFKAVLQFAVCVERRVAGQCEGVWGVGAPRRRRHSKMAGLGRLGQDFGKGLTLRTGMLTPALFTRMSTEPSVDVVKSTSCFADTGSAMSPGR